MTHPPTRTFGELVTDGLCRWVGFSTHALDLFETSSGPPCHDTPSDDELAETA